MKKKGQFEALARKKKKRHHTFSDAQKGPGAGENWDENPLPSYSFRRVRLQDGSLTLPATTPGPCQLLPGVLVWSQHGKSQPPPVQTLTELALPNRLVCEP